MAQLVDADELIILTGAEKVCLNYGKDDQTPIDEMTVAQAKQYIGQGQFEEGTILPKIEAAIDFIGNSAIRKAIITKLDAANKELGGTKIYKG